MVTDTDHRLIQLRAAAIRMIWIDSEWTARSVQCPVLTMLTLMQIRTVGRECACTCLRTHTHTLVKSLNENRKKIRKIQELYSLPTQ